MSGYVVGLDGGGTKTAVLLLQPDGGRQRSVFGPLNPHGASVEAVQKTLVDICQWLSKQPGGLAACRALCVGGAGMSNPQTADCIRGGLAAGGLTLVPTLVGDHQTALAAAYDGGDGVVLLAGTGSICYGRAGDKTARCGGWGYLVDDEGSGYALGRDILAAVVRALDGRWASTPLVALTLQALGVSSLPQLVQAVYGPDGGKGCIASLAPLLEEALRADDPAAQAIVRHAGQELALLAATVVKQLDLPEGPVALAGSVLLHNQAIGDATRGCLLARFPGLRFVVPTADAAYGAAILALQSL